MLETTTADRHDDDKNSLLALGEVLWRRKWTLLVCVFVFVAIALLYLNSATYKYTAVMSVTPVQSSSSTSKLGGLAGLASIAGVSLPQDSATMSFVLYTEGFRSRIAAEALVSNRDVMETIFEREWDARSCQFVEPKGRVISLIRAVKTVMGLPLYPWRAPDVDRLQAYLQDNIKIIQNPKSPVITIMYSHRDPRFAGTLLTLLNGVVDDSLRQKSLSRSTQYIAYLSQQIGRVTIAEHRAAIAEALSDQEKQRMFASSTLPFAAEPFGGVVVSLRPTSPQPPIVLLSAIVAGLIVGAAWIIIRSAKSNHRAPAGMEQ